MSHEPSHAVEHLPPPQAQAEEGIAWGKLLGVAIGSLVVFAISILIVVKVMQVREKELQPVGPDPMPAQIGQGEIGIVDQVPFDVSRSLQVYRKERIARLEQWGWVDRKAGIVHMPIEEAMELVVKEHKQ
jgi:hypothetical protein